jgi:hypothetical protein
MFEIKQDNILFLALDHGSGGIVAAHTNQFIIDNITSCFMDVNYKPCYPWDLTSFNPELIAELKQNLIDYKYGSNRVPVRFEPSENVSYKRYKETRNLVQVRLPYHEFLYSMCVYYYNSYSFGFTEQNDKDANTILETPDLLERYAKSLGISSYMAKQELQMDMNMIKNTRANILIAHTYYTNKINSLSTKEELDPVMNEIRIGFKFGHNYE